jgi:hypothetical protein
LPAALCVSGRRRRWASHFLVLGFMLQAVTYLVGADQLSGARELVVGASLLCLPSLVALDILWIYAPWAERREWEETWPLDHLGEPLDGDELEAAKRRYASD